MVAVLIAYVAIPLWGIGDAISQPRDVWKRVGRSKASWVVAQLLFGIVGTIAYVVYARPELRGTRLS